MVVGMGRVRVDGMPSWRVEFFPVIDNVNNIYSDWMQIRSPNDQSSRLGRVVETLGCKVWRCWERYLFIFLFLLFKS